MINLLKKLYRCWDYGAAVAQGTHNPLVVGSNPSGPIKITSITGGYFFYSKSVNLLNPTSNASAIANNFLRLIFF